MTERNLDEIQRGEAWYMEMATEAWSITMENRRTINIMLWIVVSLAAGLGCTLAALCYMVKGAA